VAALRDASGGDTDRPLVITADGKTPHELVVRAMDAAGRGGFARLSITTREPAGSAPEAK
jgi:biopolymer transport protein ExbD